MVERSHFDVLASLFHQDFDLLDETVGQAISSCLWGLPPAEIGAFKRAIRDALSRYPTSETFQSALIEAGAQLWPEDEDPREAFDRWLSANPPSAQEF